MTESTRPSEQLSETSFPVLVVGGGITGLSTALFLTWHGVSCLLVERHDDLLIHPRARGLTPRTMEAYRQVGLEKAIMAAAYAGSEFAFTPVRAETLSDEPYIAAEEPSEDDGSRASPCGFGPIDQDRLEILVRDKARELGADIRFGTELTSFEQDDAGVTAAITDRATGARHTVLADYLVAADGAASPIRGRLGIDADGPGPLYDTITAVVEADLRPALRGRSVGIAYLQQPRPFTIMLAHDDAGRRWVFGTGYDARHESLEDYTDARVVDMVRAAAGLPSAEVTLHPQIPGTDSKVLAFPIAARVAQRYRGGRVFLAGDAAHAVPPTGGLGANTGIQDAHNVAWKLAAVVNGQAGPVLLDTYHAERRPAGLLTMEQALARFGSRMGPGDGPEIVDYAAVALGYQYRSAAVLGAEQDTRPLSPTGLVGQPGTRAPHVPITRNGADASTLDLYGRDFVLLTGADGEAWASAAAELDVPVDTYRLGVDLTPAHAAAVHGIGGEGALLVRPDGFVAWRNRHGSPDPAKELDSALRKVLSR